MKALLFERNIARFAASRLLAATGSGRGVAVGPLRLVDTDEPALPGPGWHRVRPLLAGICGSDLALLDARSSRYFEPFVSFPFVPGHEIVGIVDGGPRDGERVVVESVLHCAIRGIDPVCASCAAGHTGDCEMVAFGDLGPGLQTGYCAVTGGGWSSSLVAAGGQLHPVPDGFSDDAAVMVEPTACATHAAFGVIDALRQTGDPPGPRRVVVVLGAGTLGLCTLAALRHLTSPGGPLAGSAPAGQGELTVIAVAKHPHQRRLARELAADLVVAPGELARAVRRATGSHMVSSSRPGGAGRLTGGADVVVDCVGSAVSVAEALATVRPRGHVLMVGMPGSLRLDLAPLWQREITLRGAYAYGVELLGRTHRRTFTIATDIVRAASLERLVGARYPIDRFEDALAHAGAAGSRGAVKVVFDFRRQPRRATPARIDAAIGKVDL